MSKAQPKSQIEIGASLPRIALPSTSGEPVQLASRQAKVLYFYPKDNTPGCTLEGQDFQKLIGQFRKRGIEVYGISRDSMKSHLSFKGKCGFSFDLLEDVDGKACEAFGVWVEKSMYGRRYFGIERSTFLVGPDGRLQAVWRKVKTKGHADQVLLEVLKRQTQEPK